MKIFTIQPFHLVTLSPWPLLISLNLLFYMIGMIKFFNFNNMLLMQLSFILLLMISYQWWRDITRESSYQGFHTFKVMQGLKLGMILFIISEIMFFFSFFWSYFHMSLSPSIEIGSIWPPFYMKSLLISPYELPLLNTIILVSSGMFLSLAHYGLIIKNIIITKDMMEMTLNLGMIFTGFQLWEYMYTKFTIFNSNYGTTFFMMTSFHGIHVMIGTMFIIVIYFRMKMFQLSNIHHIGFEMSAWYWHFVDVVWLFLFLILYWWPY